MFSFSRSSKNPKRTTNPNTDITSLSCQTALSAQTVENNDDLLIQILVCLPIRSLLRFKCVSRRWLSLITRPEFSFLVISKPKPISGLILYRLFSGLPDHDYEFIGLDNSTKSSTPPFRSLTFADHPTAMIILQSCNGLLLCRCSCGGQPIPNYYVYNPTTKQKTLLPPLNRGFNKIYNVCLAFDPSKSSHYKVVCIRSSGISVDQYQIEIYSSNTGPWRLSGPSFTLSNYIEFRSRVFCNNAIHWVGHWGDCLSFDIEKEKIRVVATPTIPEEEEEEEGPRTRPFRYFGESRGHLHLIDVPGSSSSQFCVYEMERDYSGWFLKYHVDLGSIAVAFPEMVKRDEYMDLDFNAFSVLCVVREENDEDSYVVLHIPNKAIRYNFKDKTFKKIHDFASTDGTVALDDEESSEFLGFDASFQFMQSLACV